MQLNPTAEELTTIRELSPHLTEDEFADLCDDAIEQAVEERNAEQAAEALRPILREIAVQELRKLSRQ